MGDKVFGYDSLNRPTTYAFDGTTYATIHYDSYSRTDYIDYNNAGSMRLTPGRDALGRTTSVTYRMGDGTTTVSDTVGLTQSGQINTDTIASGSTSLASSYTYDGAHRLTGATIGSNTYSYGFGTQDSSCGTGTNMNANSGKNSNRTTQTINSTTTTFCYDQADRLISSSDSLYNTPTYNSHGDMTQIGTNSTPLHLYYDSSGRNWAMEQYDGAGTGVGMYYNRDTQNRIITRTKNTITAWSWADVGDYFYGFTDSGDAPDFVRDPSWTILEKYLQLPGGILLTITPALTGNAQKQYNLPNLHSGTMLTTNAAGTNTSNGNGPLSSFVYDPFGNKISSGTLPANADQASFGYAGQHQKFTETNFALAPIQMGARVYFSVLGRFASVDPIEGGTPNNYLYAADPVNGSDYTGLSLLNNLFRVAAGVAAVAAGSAAILGAAACVATVVCGGAALATVGGSALASAFFTSIAVTGNSTNKVAGITGTLAFIGLGMSSGSQNAGKSTPAANPLSNTTYTPKVLMQMPLDNYHGFPMTVDKFGASGRLTPLVGSDGVTRQLLRLEGSVNGKEGYYEYIIEPDNTINHRLFVPN